jgi:sulfoquinovose isomerase
VNISNSVNPIEAEFSIELAAEFDRLLHFSFASKHPNGGFAWLNGDGLPMLDQPVETWITCRMTHIFALGMLAGRTECEPLAEHGIAALSGILHDDQHGGWFAAADLPGQGEKRAYDHAFVLLAASSCVAAGVEAADALLQDVINIVTTRFWDDGVGRVSDVRNRDWTETEPYRGANSNMHTLEAFLAVADITEDTVWLQRAQRIASWFIDGQARQHDWRIPEHFTNDWQPLPEYNRSEPAHRFRPFGATPGHAFEWSRLLLQLRGMLVQNSSRQGTQREQSPDWLLPAAISLFNTAATDGWHDGFVYTTDWAGTPVVSSQLHWVICEAIAAATALYLVTGDSQFRFLRDAWWNAAKLRFVDLDRGSWRHELDEFNQLNESVWPGKPDTYHAIQMTLVPRLPPSMSIAHGLQTSRRAASRTMSDQIPSGTEEAS